MVFAFLAVIAGVVSVNCFLALLWSKYVEPKDNNVFDEFSMQSPGPTGLQSINEETNIEIIQISTTTAVVDEINIDIQAPTTPTAAESMSSSSAYEQIQSPMAVSAAKTVPSPSYEAASMTSLAYEAASVPLPYESVI